MTRFMMIPFCVTLLLVNGLLVKSDEEPKRKLLYYPVEVGSDWVMRSAPDSKVKMTISEALLAPDSATVETSLVVIAEERKTVPVQRVLASESGLFLLSSNKTDFTPPICQMKLPSNPGDQWKTISIYNGKPYKVECTRGQDEELALPFKKVKTIRIDSVTDNDGEITKSTSWYHEELGRVKFKDNNRTVIMESFTPPPKKK